MPAILFGIVMVWAVFQASTIAPPNWHDPLWQDAAKALGRTLEGTITTDPATAIEHTIRLTAYAGIFWLSAQYGRDPANARKVLWCIALAGIAYASYGLSIYTSGNKTILGYAKWAFPGDLTSTFVGRAAYGAYAGMGLLTLLALMLHSASQAARSAAKQGQRLIDAIPPSIYCLICGSIIVATAMMLTRSRGAVMVTAIGAAVMLSILIGRAKTRRRSLAGLALLIFGAGFLILEVSGKAMLGRVLKLAHQGTGRDTVHDLAWRIIDTAPFTGHGLGSFAQLFYQFRDAAVPWFSPRYDKVHSVYIELIVDLGYIGFTVLMLAFLFILVRICIGIRVRRRDSIFGVLGLGVTVMLGVQNTLDFTLQIPAIAATYAAILGAAFAQSWPSQNRLMDEKRTI
jgi:O-antigen ligase